MKKKGFTIIELLATISILGIIATIVVLNIGNVKNIFDNSYYKSIEGNAKIAGKDYFTDDENNMPSMVNEKKTVDIQKLVELGYIEKDVVDTNNKKCDGYIINQKTKKDYKYTACLKCGDYDKTSEEYCNINWSYIEVPDDYYYNWDDNNIIFLGAKKYNNNSEEFSTAEPITISLYINNDNIQNIKYNNNSSNEIKNIIKGKVEDGQNIANFINLNDIYLELSYDDTNNTTKIIIQSEINTNISAPVITMVDNDNNKYESGVWTNKDITAKYAVDGADKYFCYHDNGSTPVQCIDNYTEKVTGEHALKVIAVSQFGTQSKPSEPVSIKIDKEQLTTTYNISGTIGNTVDNITWYVNDKTKVTFKMNETISGNKYQGYCITNTGSCSSYNIITNKTYTTEINDNKEGSKVCTKIVNNANTIKTSCSNAIYQDTVKPNLDMTIGKFDQGKLFVDTIKTNSIEDYNNKNWHNYSKYRYIFHYSDKISDIYKNNWQENNSGTFNMDLTTSKYYTPNLLSSITIDISGEGKRNGRFESCDKAGNCSSLSTEVWLDRTPPYVPVIYDAYYNSPNKINVNYSGCPSGYNPTSNIDSIKTFLDKNKNINIKCDSISPPTGYSNIGYSVMQNDVPFTGESMSEATLYGKCSEDSDSEYIQTMNREIEDAILADKNKICNNKTYTFRNTDRAGNISKTFTTTIE